MCTLEKLVLLLVIASLPCFASEIAVLRNGFSIRCLRREEIGVTTRLYPSTAASDFIDVPSDEIDHFQREFSPPPVQVPAPPRTQSVNEIINSISQRHHLDPDLVSSIIRAESGFQASAVSQKGALGLMQLMPETASKLGVSNAFDPGANIEGGTRYLRELLELYKLDLVKALAAYNAGPHRVEKYGGVPPYAETRAYVAKVIRDFNRKKLAERNAGGHSPRQSARPTTSMLPSRVSVVTDQNVVPFRSGLSAASSQEATMPTASRPDRLHFPGPKYR